MKLFDDFNVPAGEDKGRERVRPSVAAGTVNVSVSSIGYVLDNMEGAVDRATFFAKTDMPIAIIGARGTGKMYVAGIVHSESGGAPGDLVAIDCREFRNRDEANRRIRYELENAEGRTLVFKSPHLMSADAQIKLARQITTRTLADANPPRYLPRGKFVALFPDNIERLIRRAGLTDKLASAFAGYPIHVPPIKDRGQAVLRWAHKILGQERIGRKHRTRGFTPDAEQAMLMHEWKGNISEIRQRIVHALDAAEKEWISAADLGLVSVQTAAPAPTPRPFLEPLQGDDNAELPEDYTPSVLDELEVALGQAVIATLAGESPLPLGTWLADEIVLAARLRYPGNIGRAAEFLHTSSRNINRWQPKTEERTSERSDCEEWQEPSRLVQDWIREAPRDIESPLLGAQNMLLSHLERQRQTVSTKIRAQILGVSTPTYLKKLRTAESSHEPPADTGVES